MQAADEQRERSSMEDAEGQEDDPRLAALWKVAVDRLGNDHYHLSLVKEARSVLLREQLLIAQDIADVSDEQLKRAGLTLGVINALRKAFGAGHVGAGAGSGAGGAAAAGPLQLVLHDGCVLTVLSAGAQGEQEDSRQAAKRKSDEMSMKSYAPSSVDWGKALEAATRLGWRIESRFYDGEDSTREVGEFKWEEKEDDSISRAAVIQELEKQLDLPPFLELIPLERKIMFRIDEERGTKRTRITGKTDYAIVLRRMSAAIVKTPMSTLSYVVALVETKTAAANAGTKVYHTRGSAAIQCLAANIQLVKEGVTLEKEGLPVLATDMSSITSFMLAWEAEDTIWELQYPNIGVAYDHISTLLKRLGAFVLERAKAPAVLHEDAGPPAGSHTPGSDKRRDSETDDDQLSPASSPRQQHSSQRHGRSSITGSSTGKGGASASCTSKHITAELADADVADFGRYLVDVLAPGSSFDDVLVETLESSVLRAVQLKHGAPVSAPVYQPMPAAFFSEGS